MIERYVARLGYLAPWQHGGRSGKGLLTAWKQLIPKLGSAKYIWEFDLKGFFDQVSHKAIKEMPFLSCWSEAARWINGILERKNHPASYTLPPLEEDVGIQQHMFLADPMNFHEDEFDLAEIYQWSDGLQDHPLFGKIPEFVLTEDIMDPEDIAIAIKMKNKQDQIKLKDTYRPALERKPVLPKRKIFDGYDWVEVEDVTTPEAEKVREVERDNWKGLLQEGKGVPQGFNASPLISTLLTDYYLGMKSGTKMPDESIIMYMDDGLLFAQSKGEIRRLIERFKKGIAAFGVDINESKSRMIKEKGKFLGDPKFLGMRYDPKADNLYSDTRNGVSLRFPMHQNWHDVRELALLNSLDLSQTVKTFDAIAQMTAMHAGLKYGFLGALMANSMYKDEATEQEKKDEIMQGIQRAYQEILTKDKAFIWKGQDVYPIELTLCNASSLACWKLLDMEREDSKLNVLRSVRTKRKKGVLTT